MSAPSPKQRRSARAKKDAASASPPPPLAVSAPSVDQLVDLTLSISPGLRSSGSGGGGSSSDVELLSPPAKKRSAANGSPAVSIMAANATGKKLHPFFSLLGKKPPPTPATPLSSLAALPPPGASASTTEETKEGAPPSLSSALRSSASVGSPVDGTCQSATPPSPSLLPPPRCELDSLYGAKPKAEFFMTRKEKVQVRTVQRSAQFEASIEAEKQERRRLIESFKDSGKKIHPFLQPKAVTSNIKERLGFASASGSSARSEFASVSFAPAGEQPPFPPDVSHVPVDFDNVAHARTRVPHVELEWNAPAWKEAHMHVLTASERASGSHRTPRPISAPPRISPLRAPELAALMPPQPAAVPPAAGAGAAAALFIAPTLPASLPLWARPPTGAAAQPVNYLSAPAFRSSDVSNYLMQPRAQSFLRDVTDKLAARTRDMSDAPTWTLEQVQRLTRRLLIRRVHCFRAMQRDEKAAAAHRRQETDLTADSGAPGQSASSSTSALSRSERAAQRGLKAETSEQQTHSDEQVSQTFQPRPDSLWSEQYRAFRAEEMFGGNAQQRKQVRDWLHAWSQQQQRTEQQQAASSADVSTATAAAPASRPARKGRRRFTVMSDDSDFSDAYDEQYNSRGKAASPPVASAAGAVAAPVAPVTTMLLVGPPCGKSSLVYACCHETDTGVIEIGSNIRRAQRDVLAQCEEATQSRRLALVATTAGSASSASTAQLAVSKSAVPLSPAKDKPAAAPAAKKAKSEETPKPSKKAAFNFFDLSAQKKQQLEAAAAAAAAPVPRKRGGGKRSKGDKDDDDSDDDDFSLSPRVSKKAKARASSPSAAVAPAPPAQKLSKKALFAMKTQSASRLVAIKGAPEEIPDDDDDNEDGRLDDGGGGGSAGKKRKPEGPAQVKAADFFGNPAAHTPAKKAKSSSGTSALLSGGAAAASVVSDPLAPVSRASSQTAILFEEADVVFPTVDRKFLPAVRALVSNAKRPIILTASSITKDMEEALGISASGYALDPNAAPELGANGLPLIEVVRFDRPRVVELLPYLYLIAAVEIGFHSADCLSRMPSMAEVEQLLEYHQCDVRKTLLAMQMALTSTPLTLMLGSDNLLAAAANPTAAAAAVKKRAASLRLHAPERTAQQDLILSSSGLLGHKEELLALFDPAVAAAAAQALLAPLPKSLPAESATTALHMAQSTALVSARAQDLSLLHLNYLQTLLTVLASHTIDTSAGRESLLSLLPLRLAALPKTAEDMFPVESIQLPATLLSILPAGMEQPTASSAENDDKAPVETASAGASASEPTAVPVANVPAAVDAAATPSPDAVTDGKAAIAEGEEDEAAEDDDEDDEDMDDSFRLLEKRRSKPTISMDDEEEEEAAEQAEAEDVEDLEQTAATRAARMQAAAAEAQQREENRKKQRVIDEFRQQQRMQLREQLVLAEESRRCSLRAATRARQSRSPNALLHHSLRLLDDMAVLADNISAIDVCEQPPDRGVSFCRVSSRSHSRYSSALHRGVSSASRDYVPLYLDALPCFQSEGRLRLESAWAADIEEDVEEDEARRNAASLTTVSMLQPAAASADKKKTASEAPLSDVPEGEWDANREVASAVELEAAQQLRQAAHALQAMPPRAMDAKQQLACFTTLSVPSQSFLPSLADQFGVSLSASPMPAATADAPIVIDDSPPPLTSSIALQPLFLPSTEMAKLASAGSSLASSLITMRVFEPPVPHCDQSYRRECSTLAFRLWDSVHSTPLLFSSPAFLLDVLPFLRGLLWLALDSGGSAANTAADAELAASLAVNDGGRATRRSMRAMTQATPKLNRRWQQLSDCFWKNNASDAVRKLQEASVWRDVKQRPLRLNAIWRDSIEADKQAAATADATAAAVSSSAVAAVAAAANAEADVIML